jgi:hypothetical protein
LRHWLFCIHFLYDMCGNLIPGHTYYEHSILALKLGVTWWRLLQVNLRVRLQMVECLEYSLHELILSGYELIYLRVVGGLAVAGLTVALIVPCVHHLRDF